MPSEMPRLFLTRHGDTAWTDSRQRTGRTDIPLNEAGEGRAREIGNRLRRYSFASASTSPLQHASKTCTLAGAMWGDLIEWARTSMLRPDAPLASPEDFDLPICCRTAPEILDVLRERHGRWKAIQEVTP